MTDFKKIAQIYLDTWSDQITANYALYLIRRELGLTDCKIRELVEVKE
jgi:hypothetical protein